MPERYPDDATLLGLSADEPTGVEYIPTGRSPYYLEFRRLLQRTLLAAGRANDLRVYSDGDLAVGVRAGRSFLGGAVRVFSATSAVAVPPNTTTYLWLDAAGALQSGADLPTDRAAFVPLAQVVAGASAITSITDLRGEAFLHVPTLATLGLTAPAATINAALSGANASVTAAALSALTAGPDSSGDGYHRHLQVSQDAAGEAYFTLYNHSAHAAANSALAFSLPNRLPTDTFLLPSLVHGFLNQRYNGVTHNLVGSVHVQHRHEGALTASQTGKLAGAVPIDGVVTNVILSVGGNIESSNSADGVTAVAKVNGVALTTTHPQITDAAGAGFRSTAPGRGHGTAAVIKSDGTQNVQRGDVLTVDLTRAAAGTIAGDASDVVVLIVIRANQPE